MNLRSEGDPTGKSNFAKFKAEYAQKKQPSFSAIQFYPGYFGDEYFKEYAKILDFLLADGWTFVLPSEYVDAQVPVK